MYVNLLIKTLMNMDVEDEVKQLFVSHSNAKLSHPFVALF